MSPNHIATTTYLQQAPTVRSVVSTEYQDGLGRPIQSVVENGDVDVVTATQYDAIGRPWRTWAPYAAATASYVPSFSGDATAFYDAYHGPGTKPYVDTEYRPDALDRVSKVTREYIGTTPPDAALTAYGVDVTPKHTVTEVTDESGKKRRNYADVFGNVVKTVLGAGAAESTMTTFAYNVLGQRTRATDPRGLVTTYTFDTRGLLTAKTSPDAGTVQHQYDQAGNLRYTQDANQDAAGQVHFTTYDFANRPLVSGLGAADFGSLNAFTSAAFEGTDANWLVVRQYDGPPPATFPWTLFPTPPALANVSGRLAAVASKSNGAWQATFFSYDADGQVAKRYTYTQANGGGSVLTSINTTSTYVRDLRGALTARADTVGSATFHHWYEYDTRGLLWKVFASATDAKPASPDVTYTYRPSGQVESRQFQGEPQPVPLRYTIREQLEQIGDPAGTVYPFSAFYTYHPNGTVAEAQFYSAGSPAAEKRYRYVFATASYDALNRLKSADYQGWAGGWTITAAHDLANIGYDVAGNITALQRYRETGTLIDNLTYTYPGTSNRLSSVSDAVGTTTEPWDAETGSFTYDANGNLKTAPAPYGITAVTYDHQNLALSLTSNGTTTAYRYNEAGQRITKQVGTGNTEVYLLDGATSLGVFTVNSAGSPTSWFFNVLAGDKVVGRQANVGNRRYYHTDVLGSTRAVVEGTTVVESYDFEPWGLLMPGRTLAGPTKEGFTGKEQDVETGLDYFGARYYMPALGRWTAVDPLADGYPQWSSYVYTLNNPVRLIDPLGLEPCEDRQPGGTLTAKCGGEQWRAQGDAQQTSGSKTSSSDGEPQAQDSPPQWPGPRPDYPQCSGTPRCTHWRIQVMLWEQKRREFTDYLHEQVGGPDLLTSVLILGGARVGGAPGSALAPKLPAFTPGGKTAGVLRTVEVGDVPLISGRAGPAASVPRGTRGFDAYTRTHVEGHAAAVMRLNGISDATLYINNPNVCTSCRALMSRMLPDGARVTIVTPTQTTVFTGLP